MYPGSTLWCLMRHPKQTAVGCRNYTSQSGRGKRNEERTDLTDVQLPGGKADRGRCTCPPISVMLRKHPF